MANNSDPDYSPDESERSSSDEEISSEASRSSKRSRTAFHTDNDSYSSLEGITKKTKLVQKFHDENNSSFRTNQKIYKNHLIGRENIVYVYHCDLCYYQTLKKDHFKTHFIRCKQSNTKKIVWGCPECNIQYRLEDLVDEHRIPIDQDDIDKNIFHCLTCTSDPDGKRKVVILEKVHPYSTSPFVCRRCKVQAFGIQILKKHLSSKHGITIEYKCQYCPYSTLESDSLQKHKKSHTDLQEMGLIQCSHCPSQFFTMSEIKEHMKKVKWQKFEKEFNQSKMKNEKDTKEKSDVGKTEDEFEIFVPIQLDRNDEDVGSADGDNVIRASSEIGKWQLKCTLCSYMNYSEASCHRHVKNKHRPYGYSVVTFHKYYEDQFKGSIRFGKIQDGKDRQQSTVKKIIDWTHSDEDDVVEKNAGNNEVITIELASDTEVESNKCNDNSENSQVKNKNGNNQTSNDEDDSAVNKNTLRCKQCGYQAKHMMHLLIHEELIHKILKGKDVFTCPRRNCTYGSRIRSYLRRHLKKYHRYNVDSFYSKELKCADCRYVAKKPLHLMAHRKNTHEKPGVKPTRTKTSVMDHDYCIPSTSRRIVKEKSVKQADQYSKLLSCKHCGQQHPGAYQLAWHMFVTHRNKSELKNWILKCKMCNYENYSKQACDKHALQHETSHVTFRKLYKGKLKGAVKFRYLHRLVAKRSSAGLLESKFQNSIATRKNFIKLEEEEIIHEKKVSPKLIQNVNPRYRNLKNENEAAKSLEKPHINSRPIKILDWTESDEENMVEELGTVGEKKASDDDDKSNEIQELGSDDDVLLQKKAEFYTCPKCTYETNDQSHLPFHEILVHGPPISSEDAKYQCKHCEFESKYRHSFKRHIMRLHKYNVDEFYTAEQDENTTRPKITKTNDYKNDTQLEKFFHYQHCRLCSKNYMKYTDQYQLAWHMLQGHRDKTELLKWCLRCTLCSYETYSKKHARNHAISRHSGTIETLITFDKYYEDILKGNITFEIEKGTVHSCNFCAYKSTTWECLRKHYRTDHKNQKLRPSCHESDEQVHTREVNSAHEIHQNEIIRIEITADSEDGANRSEDSSQNDERVERDEESVEWGGRADEDSEDLKYFYEYKKEMDNDNETNKTNYSSGNDDDDDDKILSAEITYVENECFHSGCEYRTQNKHRLKRHCLSVHKDTETKLAGIFSELKQFTCTSCEFQSPTLKGLKVHTEQKHTLKCGYNEICPSGHDKANQTNNLSQHDGYLKQKKERSESNKCSNEYAEDSIRFSRLKTDVHKKTSGDMKIASDNDGETNKPEVLSEDDDTDLPVDVHYVTNKCIHSDCEYRTYRKGHLKRHCLNVHKDNCRKLDDIFSGLKQFECTVCKFQSPTLKAMNEHIQEKHTSNCENQSENLTPSNEHLKRKKEPDDYSENDIEEVKSDLPADINYVGNKCIHSGCEYRTPNKNRLKRYRLVVHKYTRNKFDKAFSQLKRYNCSLCKFQSETLRKIYVHLRQKHNIDSEYKEICENGEDKANEVHQKFELYRDQSELLKRIMRCTMCNFKTRYARSATRHAIRRHSSITEPVVVKFDKYYEDKFDRSVKYRCKKRKLHQCNKCRFVGGTWESIRDHIARHKKANFKPRLGRLRKEQDIIHKGVREKADSVIDETDNRSNTVVLESYTKQQILDIIGCDISEVKDEEKSKEVCNLNIKKAEDLLGELTEENLEGNKNTSTTKENNEVITIEITPDEDLVTKNKDNKETTKENPVTLALIIESGEKEQLSTVGQKDNSTEIPPQYCGKSEWFKCSKADCKYSCDSLKEVTDPVKSCTHNSRKVITSTKFICHLCDDVVTNRNLLHTHSQAHALDTNNTNLTVKFSEVVNNRFRCVVDIKAKIEKGSAEVKGDAFKSSNKLSYKCWMCGFVIFTKHTLQNHTNIHAREDGNLKLKVRYSKFREDKMEGTIIMQNDPNYVPRKVKPRQSSPELEYDPNLPVLSCDECNFKTNENEVLKKHKNLHWTPKKEALFRAQKWFTCSVCFFHCFDVETFKQHGEWHKTHYSTTGSIRKLGKNSWFLK